MNCIHLVIGREKTCEALEKTYMPSPFQLAEYCRNKEYRKCPLYLRNIVSAGRGDAGIGGKGADSPSPQCLQVLHAVSPAKMTS